MALIVMVVGWGQLNLILKLPISGVLVKNVWGMFPVLFPVQ